MSTMKSVWPTVCLCWSSRRNTAGRSAWRPGSIRPGCGLKWSDIDFGKRTIHICRNVVKVSGEEIIVKEPKTAAGDRYVYFSAPMESLLKEYRKECAYETSAYEKRELTEDDYVFRKHGEPLPMTPTTFTWRFKLILRKYGLPDKLNIHSLRHQNVK